MPLAIQSGGWFASLGVSKKTSQSNSTTRTPTAHSTATSRRPLDSIEGSTAGNPSAPLLAAYNEVKRHEKAIREMELKFQELRNQGMR